MYTSIRKAGSWWRHCAGCVNWGKVTGLCRYCSRCPYAAGKCLDLFEKK